MFKIILICFSFFINNAIYASEQAKRPKLKDFADIFFNSLNDDSYSLNITQGYGHNSNIHEITDVDYDDDPESFYHLKSSHFYNTHVDAYYSFFFPDNLLGTFYFDFYHKLYLKKETNILDERYFAPGIEFKYNYNERHSLSFLYLYTHERERKESRGQFFTYSNIHKYTPAYFYTFTNGNILFAETFLKKIQYVDLESINDYGIKIGLTTYQINNYLYPSLSCGYNYINETDEGISDSEEFFLSLSNYFYPHDHFNGYLTIDYTDRSNQDIAYAYQNWGINLFTTLSPIILESLAFNASISYDYYKLKSRLSKDIMEYVLSLTYSAF